MDLARDASAAQLAQRLEPFPHIPVDVSHLTLTPIKGYEDTVKVQLYLGDKPCLETEYVVRGEDGKYTWIVSSTSGVRRQISSMLYDVELVLLFQSKDRLRRSTERVSKRIKLYLKEVLLGTASGTIKLEDGTIMGTIDLKIDIVKPLITVSDLPDIDRQTHIPMLQYVGDMLRDLQKVKTLTDGPLRDLYKTIVTVYAALWIRWRRELNQKVQAHGPTSLTRNDQVITAIMAARDNALEDTVLQFHWQLRLASRCFDSESLVDEHRRKLFTQLCRLGAEGAIIVYQWAERNPNVTWTGLELMASSQTQSDDHRMRLKNALEDLERLHLEFLSLSYEMLQVQRGVALLPLPKSKIDMLRFLYERALEESRERVNMGPYTSAFECILGPNAEIVFKWMMEDFEKSESLVRDRDALRRLMTHLAQRSGRLPEAMILSDVTYHHELGDVPRAVAGGGFADVYRGKYTSKGGSSFVAIKQLRLLAGATMQKRIKQMYLEILTCRTLKHPNILSILGVCREVRSLSVVTPWLNNGHVHSYLAKISAEYLTIPTWMLNKWINNIAQGLAYLHSEGMAHGDLRGVNILIDDNEVARIADFGLAVYVNGHSQNYASMRSGNVQWFAPELLRPTGGRLTVRPTPAADVYSLSHVCIELYTSGSPYPELSEDSEMALGSFINQVMDPVHPLRPGRPKHMPDVLWAFVQSYWCADPAVRPTAADVVRDVSVLDQQPPGSVEN